MFDGDIQQQVFDKIAQQLPPDAQVVTEVAKVLHMSNDAVYRRMNGKTALLAQELAQLLAHFQISMDVLVFKQSATVFSQFSAFANPVKSFQEL